MTEKEHLIEGLNMDLSGEYQAIIMYNTFAASAVGPYRQELQNFFQAEIKDELEHASYLANKISSLGGTPCTQPQDVEVPENIKGMLESAARAEEETIARYRERRRQAEEVGDLGLTTDLEDMISDETTHLEECRKMLRGNW